MYIISPQGKKALVTLEGYRLSVYKDAALKLTIGVGHLLTPTELSSGNLDATGEPFGPGISRDDVEKIFDKDTARFESGVNEQLDGARLYQYEFDALACWAYNVGLGACRSSTLLRAIHQGKHQLVPNELRKWTRAGGKILAGLVNRREAEISIWTNGDYDVERFLHA